MILGEIVFAARDWLVGAALLAAAALAVLVWSYRRSGRASLARVAAGSLKLLGIVALALCLIEPLYSGTRPRPGSNLFLVVADNSKSLQIHDRGAQRSRGEALRETLADDAAWQTRLAQDFDLRRYGFDSRLMPLKDFSELTHDGGASALCGSLSSLAERFHGLPLAGMLVFTDGNATDLADLAAAGKTASWQNLPPIYPVVVGADSGLKDLSVSRVSVSQTNFEAAPVSITAEMECQGLAGRTAVIRVLDDAGKEIERRTVPNVVDDQPLVERFQLRPKRTGISFYTVCANLEGEEAADEQPGRTAEATLANNRRLVTVDRGGGPYRVLYVTGRLNWEYKFLRRALQEDDEVDLVGLVRIAKKEPKFSFRGRQGERTNPIFRGFGNQGDEQAEQYDEPVLLRLGTEDKEELRGGFPKAADDLFRYHAVILDDVEAAFFTQEQMSLLQKFVSQRGGGFLMLGGRDSFVKGGYARTPVGELLPVYLDRGQPRTVSGGYRLLLTREGWLQPWVRVRTTEQEEEQRLAKMPSFKSVNFVSAIKPGASVLAQVAAEGGEPQPAIIVQQFGRGRAAALTIGDLWRWNLSRAEGAESDLEKSWRQTVRWLVADVPQRVELETNRGGGPPGLPNAFGQPLRITVRARDKSFEPLDNATVTVRIDTPDEREIELTAEPSETRSGEYQTTFAPRTPGAYRASAVVVAADGSDVGTRDAGSAVEPATEEFRTLRANRVLLERIAADSGGEIVSADELDSFVAGLPNRKVPVVESWTYPLWHQWSVFLFAVACLVGEWGLRRWTGLP